MGDQQHGGAGLLVVVLDFGQDLVPAFGVQTGYGSLRAGIDNLVIIDDSIVRGTTLRQSIIGILDRLNPKKIVIVSSSPQVRYPDYYGIDMAKMSEFIAFKAAVELLKERDMKDVIAAAYRKSKDQVGLPKEQLVNYVKDIYAPFTDEEISAKMVELLTPKGTKAKVEIVYQPLSGLHEAVTGTGTAGF